ncbi:MAG: hypothetical protein LDL26_10130 [Caenispirillum bisanense]|nr:hypothetical protein [Caenispirillum bisanense]MCA1974097.1 hypothetical protein [Caenispirillum sp.]
MITETTGQTRIVHCRLFRVCWRSPVTSERGMSGPMSRAQAEFLVRDESIGNPLRRFWIEPWFEETADDVDDAAPVVPRRRVN